MCSPNPYLPICVGHLKCNLSAAATQCAGLCVCAGVLGASVCWCVYQCTVVCQCAGVFASVQVDCRMLVCVCWCAAVCQCTSALQCASVPVCVCHLLQQPTSADMLLLLLLPAPLTPCCHYCSFLFSLPPNHCFCMINATQGNSGQSHCTIYYTNKTCRNYVPRPFV